MHSSLGQDCNSRREWVTGVCPAMDQAVTCPVCIPAGTPSTPNLPLWCSLIHTENRLKYWEGTIIPVKHLIIILPYDYLWEQTPGPSADPSVAVHLSMWHFPVPFSIQGPEIHQCWWVHAPSDTSVPNSSLWAVGLLLCFSAVYVVQRANSRANPGLCVLMSGICCLIELHLIN